MLGAAGPGYYGHDKNNKLWMHQGNKKQFKNVINSNNVVKVVVRKLENCLF